MAGIVIVIATVFGIDRLLAYRERLKWKQAKANVLMEISACLNGLLTNIRGLAAIDVSALDLPTAGEMSSDEWSRRVNQNMRKFFESEKATITQAVRRRNQESWDNFFTASQSCIQELEKLLAMFPSISSEPELVEKIAQVRSDARLLYTVRIIFPDILGIPLEKQPIPKDGDKKASSEAIHNWAVSSVEKLIDSI
ncbi:unnamed protein product, partial [marine sediment metagenome]